MVPGESRDDYGKAAPGLVGNLPCMAGQIGRREPKLVESVLRSGGRPERIALNCARKLADSGRQKEPSPGCPGLGNVTLIGASRQ